MAVEVLSNDYLFQPEPAPPIWPSCTEVCNAVEDYISDREEEGKADEETDREECGSGGYKVVFRGFQPNLEHMHGNQEQTRI